MFDNEAKTNGNKIEITDKIETQHIHKIIWPVTFLHLVSPANVI